MKKNSFLETIAHAALQNWLNRKMSRVAICNPGAHEKAQDFALAERLSIKREAPRLILGDVRILNHLPGSP
jgi:hypothetical protein